MSKLFQNKLNSQENPLQKKYQRKCKTDLKNQAHLCVRNFSKRVDSKIIIYGSFNNGTQSYDSNIDLITTTPLPEIQSILKTLISSPQIFKSQTDEKIQVFDEYQGFTLDIIKLNSKNKSQALRDKIIKRIVEWDDLVLKCVQRLKKWRKQQEDLEGEDPQQSKASDSMLIPNNQEFQVIMFQILMKMQLVPFLNEVGEFEMRGQTPNKNLSVNQIVNTFMRFLTIQDNQEVVDLASCTLKYSSQKWIVLDPASKDMMDCMTGPKATTVSLCAQNQLRFKSFEESQQKIVSSDLINLNERSANQNNNNNNNQYDQNQNINNNYTNSNDYTQNTNEQQNQQQSECSQSQSSSQSQSQSNLNNDMTDDYEEFNIRSCMIDQLEVATAIKKKDDTQQGLVHNSINNNSVKKIDSQVDSQKSDDPSLNSQDSVKIQSDSTESSKMYKRKDDTSKDTINALNHQKIQCREQKAQ